MDGPSHKVEYYYHNRTSVLLSSWSVFVHMYAEPREILTESWHLPFLLIKIQTNAYFTCKQRKVEVNTTECNAETTNSFTFYIVFSVKIGQDNSVDEIK
jgi:hypothetical protein